MTDPGFSPAPDWDNTPRPGGCGLLIVLVTVGLYAVAAMELVKWAWR